MNQVIHFVLKSKLALKPNAANKKKTLLTTCVSSVWLNDWYVQHFFRVAFEI